jgi:hypothetical protein
MSIMTVLAQSLRPERLGHYEEAVRRLAERAVTKKEEFHWSAYQTAFGDLGTIYYTSVVESWAEIANRGTSETLAERVLGEKEGRKLISDLRECVLSSTQTVSAERPDLSYQRDAATAPTPFAVVTAVRVRPDGQDAFEEFLRKIAEAIPKVDEPAQISTRQILIGNLREYRVIRPLDDLAELDAQRQPADLLTKAFGAAEGGLFVRNGLAAIELVERRIVAYRKDLSNPAR